MTKAAKPQPDVRPQLPSGGGAYERQRDGSLKPVSTPVQSDVEQTTKD